MAAWFWYAVVAAVLYGAHQIFTRMAAERIGAGLGGFIVEGSAALSILIYLTILWFGGRWSQKFSAVGFNYSLLTGGVVRFIDWLGVGGGIGLGWKRRQIRPREYLITSVSRITVAKDVDIRSVR
jgi:hypothetical protein